MTQPLVCDFCGTPVTKEEVTVIPTGDFIIPELNYGNSSWGWGGCVDCGNLMKEENWPALLDRAVRYSTTGEPIRGPLSMIYAGIRANQTGPLRGWDDEIDGKPS
jgi:hypothetical protein